MTNFNRSSEECTDLDERDVRALVQKMTVLADIGEARGAEDVFVVVSESGKQYTVDARHDSCSCPDAEYRDRTCKHQRRVAFATGGRPIPAWVNVDVVDSQLGEHVAGPVATDGGVGDVHGPDQETTVDEAEDDEEECESCAELPAGWPCAHCAIVKGEAITAEGYDL